MVCFFTNEWPIFQFFVTADYAGVALIGNPTTFPLRHTTSQRTQSLKLQPEWNASPPSYVIFYPKILFQIYLNYFFSKKTLPIPPCTTPQANAHDPSNCPLNQMRHYLRSSIPTPKHLPRHSMPVALATVAWNLPRLATECVTPLLLLLCYFYPKYYFKFIWTIFFNKKTIYLPPSSLHWSTIKPAVWQYIRVHKYQVTQKTPHWHDTI